MKILPVTVRAAQGWLSTIRVFLWKSILYGAFLWVCKALNSPKRRIPARAVEKDKDPTCGLVVLELVGPTPQRNVSQSNTL